MENKNLETEQFNQCHSGLDPESQRRQATPKAIHKEILNQVQDDRIMEQGRSMVEMLGVLAVVGLLSVMAFAGFRIALNKAKANTIVHDGRMVWAEALAWQTVPKRNDWIDSRYASESGKTFYAMRDIKDNNYVKVEGVEEEVCERMLSMQQEGMLLFLTTEYEDFTTCEEGDHNIIVMAFDGLSGKPAECKDQKGCQDLYSDAFYCDGDGHCQECDESLSYVNSAGDGCECRSNARSCDGDGAPVWCCPNAEICGNKLNECVTCEDPLTLANEAGTACVCDPTIAVSCDDGQGHTWCCGGETICDSTVGTCRAAETNCSYDLNQGESGYAADCHYTVVDTVPDPTNAPNVHTITLTADSQHKCKSDKYCYLYYKDATCGAAADANAGTTATNRDLWGVCLNKDQVNTQCQITGGEIILTRHTGCPAGSYCYLKWTQVSADQVACSSNTAGASYIGTFWGTCISTNSNSAACPITNLNN